MKSVLPVELKDGESIGSLDIGAVARRASDGRAGAVTVVGAVGCCGILNVVFQLCEESGVEGC